MKRKEEAKLSDRIQMSMDFLTNCVCKTNDFECKYTPISMRFIEKSPEFVEKLLNDFLTNSEKKLITKRFGLEDGKKVTHSCLFNEFNIKNKTMLKKAENEIFRKINGRISKYLEMCQCEKIEDSFIDLILGEIGIERFIDLFSKLVQITLTHKTVQLRQEIEEHQYNYWLLNWRNMQRELIHLSPDYVPFAKNP